MGKKIALLLNVLLFAGFFFFFVFYSEPTDIPDTLEPGSLAGEVRQAEKLLESLGRGLDAQAVRL